MTMKGVAGTGSGVGGSSTVRQFKLLKESELRVEVGPDSPIRIRLTSGTAEIFGTELPPENWVSFPPLHKFAMFTWNGAALDVEGTTEVEYVADETPMISYVNVHAILDARRARAKEATTTASADSVSLPVPKESQGPRVIVVGPTDSGKSTLSKMLLSWASKQGWKPTFVDLDVGQGSITIPGCISATPIEMPIDPVEGIPLEMPIVYFLGHVNPSGHADLYKVLVKELAKTLERQFTENSEARAAGMVINTMGWVEGVGYELLLHSIEALNADVVLVLGQERLCSMLKDVLKTKGNVDVVKLHKSGGVVSRNAKFRQRSRNYRIREYFYGLSNDFSPHSNVVSFNDVTIFRLGGGPQAPRSALPVGAEPLADPTRLSPASVSLDMLHQILGVSYAKESDQVISSNVAGFIYITDIDMQRKKITYLAPCPGELPSQFLLVGMLTWFER
ncbi:unnamed protein product [Victoria cruziana]